MSLIISKNDATKLYCAVNAVLMEQLRQMEVDLMPKSSMLDAEPLPLPLALTSVYKHRTEPVVLP